jgi:hypothetical protein
MEEQDTFNIENFTFDSPSEINTFIAFQRIFNENEERTKSKQQNQHGCQPRQSEIPWTNKGGISPQNPPKGLGKDNCHDKSQQP